MDIWYKSEEYSRAILMFNKTLLKCIKTLAEKERAGEKTLSQHRLHIHSQNLWRKETQKFASGALNHK